MKDDSSPSEVSKSAGASFPDSSGSRKSEFGGGSGLKPGAFGTVWGKIAPFFMSAALFLSGFFAIFSPLPLVLLGMSRSRKWLVPAAFTNGVLVYLTSGPAVFQFYLLSIVALGLLIPFFLSRRLSPESIVGRAWVVQWCLIVIVLGVYALRNGVTPWDELQKVFGGFFDVFLENLKPESRERLIDGFGGGEEGLAEWRKKTMSEFPGALGIFCLLVSWFNLRVLFSLNPGRVLNRLGYDRNALNRWKNPDWLVWPTLGCWGVVLFVDGTAADIALNGFKVLMAAYAIQGVAILGAGFDAYRVGSFFRILAYSLILILMVPLLLSIGFFDQWFDFRSKFRQTV